MRFLILLLVINFVLVNGKRVAPHHVIDLDRPAFYRWREIAQKFGSIFSRVAGGLYVRYHLRFYKDQFSQWKKLLKEPYITELNGFAHYGNVSRDVLLATQYLYDVSTYCTSIVCVDKNNVVWHARNLDYGNNRQEAVGLQNLTVSLTFLKGGKPLFKSVTFAGLLGTFTGMRLGAYSISMNQRMKGGLMNRVAPSEMFKRYNKIWPVSIYIRDILQNVGDFKTVFGKLRNDYIMAPCYLILAGLSGEQGVVITRSPLKTINIRQLSKGGNSWFVAQTNHDSTERDPDYRSTKANKLMNAMGRNITEQHLFKVLFTPPVKAKTTVFSYVMSASKTMFQGFLP